MSITSDEAIGNARGEPAGLPKACGDVAWRDVQRALDAGFGPDEVVWMFDLPDRSALDQAIVERWVCVGSKRLAV